MGSRKNESHFLQAAPLVRYHCIFVLSIFHQFILNKAQNEVISVSQHAKLKRNKHIIHSTLCTSYFPAVSCQLDTALMLKDY
jgi:hypothetical protein